MKKKIKIGIIFLAICIVISGWFAFDNLKQDNNSFTYVNDKLKNKTGQEIISTGIARTLKGYYIEHDMKDLDCLFIEDISLIKTFSNAIGKEITVKGKVEKKITDYGECIGPKQMCGINLEYCINVEEIITNNKE